MLMLVAAASVLLQVSAASAQLLPPGPQVLTFFSDVDDTEQPYALYLPPNFDASRRYPLVVSLHGAGSNHRLNLRRPRSLPFAGRWPRSPRPGRFIVGLS